MNVFKNKPGSTLVSSKHISKNKNLGEKLKQDKTKFNWNNANTTEQLELQEKGCTKVIKLAPVLRKGSGNQQQQEVVSSDPNNNGSKRIVR